MTCPVVCLLASARQHAAQEAVEWDNFLAAAGAMRARQEAMLSTVLHTLDVWSHSATHMASTGLRGTVAGGHAEATPPAPRAPEHVHAHGPAFYAEPGQGTAGRHSHGGGTGDRGGVGDGDGDVVATPPPLPPAPPPPAPATPPPPPPASADGSA